MVGGVEHQFARFLAHPLAGDGIRHEIMVGEPPHRGLWPDIEPHVSAVHSFKRMGALRLPRRPASLRDSNVARLVKQSEPDVLLSWSAFARTELSRACRRARVPMVHREGGGAWFRHSPQAAVEYIAELSGAVCNTRASRRMLQLKWGFEGPARVCLGGVRPDLLAKADARTARVDRGRWRIGTAARLAAEKGLCLAIHALYMLRRSGLECELAVAGSGPELSRLQQLAAELGVEEYVKFLGRVKDIAAFYQSLDVLLHPAVREPLGNVTIEAGAFGVPVVATRVDGMAETIQHGTTGFTVAATEPMAKYAEYGGTDSSALPEQVYDPDEDALREVRFVHPQELTDAVSEILLDQALYERMATSGASFVRERFSFDRYIAELLDAVRHFASPDE